MKLEFNEPMIGIVGLLTLAGLAWFAYIIATTSKECIHFKHCSYADRKGTLCNGKANETYCKHYPNP